MKHGAQTKLSARCNVTATTIHDLLSGRRSASFPLAKRIAETTGSDPMIWLRGGGTPEERQAAVEAWASHQNDDAQATVTDD